MASPATFVDACRFWIYPLLFFRAYKAPTLQTVTAQYAWIGFETEARAAGLRWVLSTNMYKKKSGKASAEIP